MFDLRFGQFLFRLPPRALRRDLKLCPPLQEEPLYDLACFTGRLRRATQSSKFLFDLNDLKLRFLI